MGCCGSADVVSVQCLPPGAPCTPGPAVGTGGVRKQGSETRPLDPEPREGALTEETRGSWELRFPSLIACSLGPPVRHWEVDGCPSTLRTSVRSGCCGGQQGSPLGFS